MYFILLLIFCQTIHSTLRKLIDEIPKETRLNVLAPYLDSNSIQALSKVNRKIRQEIKQVTPDTFAQQQYYQQAMDVLSITPQEMLQKFKYLPYNGLPLNKVSTGKGMFRGNYGMRSTKDLCGNFRYYLSFLLRDMTERKHKTKLLIFAFNQNGTIEDSILLPGKISDHDYCFPVIITMNAQNAELLKEAYGNKVLRIGNYQLLNRNAWFLFTWPMMVHLNLENIVRFGFVPFNIFCFSIMAMFSGWFPAEWSRMVVFVQLILMLSSIQYLYYACEYYNDNFRI